MWQHLVLTSNCLSRHFLALVNLWMFMHCCVPWLAFTYPQHRLRIKHHNMGWWINHICSLLCPTRPLQLLLNESIDIELHVGMPLLPAQGQSFFLGWKAIPGWAWVIHDLEGLHHHLIHGMRKLCGCPWRLLVFRGFFLFSASCVRKGSAALAVSISACPSADFAGSGASLNLPQWQGPTVRCATIFQQGQNRDDWGPDKDYVDLFPQKVNDEQSPKTLLFESGVVSRVQFFLWWMEFHAKSTSYRRNQFWSLMEWGISQNSVKKWSLGPPYFEPFPIIPIYHNILGKKNKPPKQFGGDFFLCVFGKV